VTVEWGLPVTAQRPAVDGSESKRDGWSPRVSADSADTDLRTGPTIDVALIWALSRQCAITLGPDLREIQVSRVRRLLEQAGVAEHAFIDPRTRVPARVFSELLASIVDLTGDGASGIRAGASCEPGAFGLVEQLARTAGTLRDAFECYARYGALIQEDAKVELRVQGERTVVSYRSPELSSRRVTDFVLAYLATQMHHNTSGGVCFHEVHLRALPPPHRDAYEEMLGVPARFGMREDALVLSTSALQRPSVFAHPHANNLLEARACRALDRLAQATSCSARVEKRIREQLAAGHSSMQETARILSTSVSTLRRRLADEGTTFSEILDRVRAEVAMNALARRDEGTSEVAARLGYAHSTAFYKAFKRWTGLSPSAYRTQHGASVDRRYVENARD